ncbi:uncharacterized protein LOC126552407 [Aphis gossypii]|uniref:uncharacterized protein LOC126552407 n=1 Tax=Aphis gossypii TaxID=80765 RepID=UPI002158E2CC|nr:uncharacterized protein LOC126552407 [Aphis gossypii]
MEQPDLNYLKMVIRSILTSSPGKVTISQISSDYSNFEGCNLSFEHLGFKTIYELLENMSDVLRIPQNPNMNSFVTLIVDEKTSHLRELVVNQKTKKQRPKKNISTLRSSNNHLPTSANYKFCVNNLDNQRNEYTISTIHKYNTPRYENSTPRYATNARGYDRVKLKSVNSKPNGTVTTRLRSDVENLCNTSKRMSIPMLKNFLINHPDYKKMGTSHIEESINMLKYFIYIDKQGVHLKVPTQDNIENKCMSSTIQQFTSKPSHHEIVSEKKCEENNDTKNCLKIQKDDYKSAIVAIISRSNEPITINKVLSIFQEEYGHTFPLKNFFCRTYMDFFRLYPHIFKLEDQCSTNSVVSLEKQIILEPKTNIRKQFNKASIFNNNIAVTNSGNTMLNSSKLKSEYLSNESSYQMNKYPLVDNSYQSHSVKSIDSYEMYDSDTVLDTMKVKMRRILSKHKDGILCNDFMDIYGKEYNSHFNFFEYGFRSMRDMAYKLPSVFYVKVTDDDNDCILFEADRRSELENNLEDPSLYYKNIPKTILYNLSHFFNKHWNGVKFNELMSLYCAEYGRAYEPLKYGYSSEKHMFESLDKMVEIENNQLFTIDPFAYAECFKNKNVDVINHQDNSSIADDFLLHYTGKDICNGKFRYSKIKLNDQKVAKIIVSEVYNPSSFYIQLEAEVNNLNKFMDTLQLYYEKNEEKYKVIPRLILPELPCASCYEDSNLWLRAMVLNIVDEENVKLSYVDYGTIKVVSKTNVRLLASQFGAYPIPAVHCGLYNFSELNYPREISESFAEMTDDHVLEAQFHHPHFEDDSQKMNVTLFLNTEHDKININKKCFEVIMNQITQIQNKLEE